MTGKPTALNKNTPLPEATPAALADAWWQLVRAAEEPGISKEDSEALIGRADAVLDRLAETLPNAKATLVADILFLRTANVMAGQSSPGGASGLRPARSGVSVSPMWH